MITLYTYPKSKIIQKKDTEFLAIVFTNGDYLELHKQELTDFSPVLCDKLRVRGDKICFFGGGGQIKCNISQEHSRDDDYRLSDKKQYLQDRKTYIERRCCDDEEVDYFVICDEDHWNFALYGEITAQKVGDELVFSFAEKGQTQSESGVMALAPLEKNQITSLELEFENCECYCILRDEIEKMQLDLSPELVWKSDDLNRNLVSGYMVLNFDSDFTNRGTIGEITKSQLTKRICGARGINDHDICNLYMRYDSSYRTPLMKERIYVDDVRSEAELEALEKQLDEKGLYDDYVGGCAKRLSKGRVAIAFGKDAKEILKNIQ